MSVTVYMTLEDITAQLALTFTKIELERATSADGSYVEQTEITLVAGQYAYSYVDTTGTIDLYYRWRLSSADNSLKSDYTPPFRPVGTTRKRLRQFTMVEYEAGEILAAIAGGSTSVAKFSDYRVFASAFAADRGVGTFLYPTTGLNAAAIRRVIAPTDPALGTYTVSPVWAQALSAADEVEWHWLASPDIWNRAINRALKRYPYIDSVPIIGDDSGEQLLSNLPFLTSRRQVLGVWYYPTGYTHRAPWGSYGRWWQVRQDSAGLYLTTKPASATTTTLFVDVIRPADPLLTDDSVMPNAINIDCAAALVYDEVLASMSRPRLGSNASERAVFYQQRVLHQTKLKSLLRVHAPQPVTQPPQLSSPSRVPTLWKAR